MLIGKDPNFMSVVRKAETVAKSNCSVLIYGETGVGKGEVAKHVFTSSDRKNRLFVRVNCAAVQDTLLESEMFGHAKGSFTGAIATKIGKFELADGGTLFLDEIGDMSLMVQSKILRTIEEGEFERVGCNIVRKVNVRIICATNRDLEKCIENGTFRKDLYYRLKTVALEVPPLRTRPNDIELLAEHFLYEFNNAYGKILVFDNGVIPYLCKHGWDGNVRELRNAVEGAVALCDGDKVTMDHLGFAEYVHTVTPGRFDEFVRSFVGVNGYNMDSIVKRVKKLLVEEALSQCGGVQKDAARLLGISPRMIHYTLDKVGLDHFHRHAIPNSRREQS